MALAAFPTEEVDLMGRIAGARRVDAEPDVARPLFLLGFRVGIPNRKITGWTRRIVRQAVGEESGLPSHPHECAGPASSQSLPHTTVWEASRTAPSGNGELSPGLIVRTHTSVPGE